MCATAVRRYTPTVAPPRSAPCLVASALCQYTRVIQLASTSPRHRVYLLRTADGASRALALAIGRIPSHHIRLLLYRKLLRMSIGRKTTVYRRPEIRKPSRIEIGEYCSIGADAVLDGRCGLRLGNNVNLSKGVWIWTMQHDKDSPDFGASGGPVVVGDHAWLSSRVLVLPGVQIGDGAVVCAGAVVTSDVEAFAVVGGVPARKIGERTRDLRYTLAPEQYRVPFL
jgi:acetyltransferase-like isoleucine patch superfamily enzyme